MRHSDGPTQPLLGGRATPIYYTSTDRGSIEQAEAGSAKVAHVIDRSVERDTVPETATYGRNLSWTSAYLLTISRLVGSGIFATPGNIYREVGSPGLALLVWLIGAAIAACGLAVSMELGCMLPRSGGHKVYLEFMYRRPRFLASTLVAVQAIFLQFTAANCIVFSEYLLFALGYQSGIIVQRSLAVGLITAITIIHGCFLKPGIWIQDLLAWVKLGLMAFMALVGLAALFLPRQITFNQGANDISWSQLMRGSVWSWGTMATAILQANFSFAGADSLVSVLNEVKNPVKTLKTSAPFALLTVTLFYLMINIAFFMIVPLKEFEKGGELVAALFFEKLFGASVGGKALPLLAAISAASNVMSTAFGHGRINQEIARQGFFPFSKFLSSSRPFNAPLCGLIVNYVPSVLVIILPPQREVYSFILNIANYPGQVVAFFICFGTLWLRKTRPDLKRPFKVWKSAVFLRLLISASLIVAPFIPLKDERGHLRFEDATYALVGLGILLCGVLYWYMWTVVIPRWRNYRLEEETDVLEDGTTITRLVKVHGE